MSRNGPFTTGQVAAYCNVSQGTIINWIKGGQLSGYTTPGGHYRVPRPDLISFLESNDMPVDTTLRKASRPRVILLSDDPKCRDVVRSASENDTCDIGLVDSDYAAVAEAVKSNPDLVIIDENTASDPLRLCRWLTETTDSVRVLMVGERCDPAAARASGAEAYLSLEALHRLEAKLRRLLP